ncbi:MAG: hypothetical protein E7590_01765 [Ruminococcaceae bacterium]|nr:hypothetical protein [Oscillospiraceae bacterium]
MKTRAIAFFLILFLFATAFAACGRKAAPFNGFSRPFSADVTGELGGVAFSATVQGEEGAEDGALPLTVTFYAPKSLCGTVLRRTESGECRIEVGETALPVTAEFRALFALFPTTVAAERVAVTEEGLTAVEAVGVRFLFLRDDTLYRIESPDGYLNIVSIAFG